MSSKTKRISEVPVLEQATENTNLLVEENGETSRIPIGAVLGTSQDLTAVQDPNCHAEFFNIDYYGVISLKPEYRGHPSDDDCPYAISDNGVGKDGSKINELPENITLPEVVNKTAVLGLVVGMFEDNWRIKSVTFPSTVDAIPVGFCRGAGSLRHIYNTEHITTIGKQGFQNSGITKAFFPSLKELSDSGVFGQCALLQIVDIGNEITTIPNATFGNCKYLSCVKGGGSVTTLGTSAFQGTRNLTSVPFMPYITKMGDAAFLGSRIQYDWDSIKSSWENSTCATPIQDNTDYWSECTPSDYQCENRLVTMLCQKDPGWIDEQYGTTKDKYSSGCGVMVALHIHSAITGKKYDSPKDFEADIGALENGADLLATVIDTVDALVELLNSLGADEVDTEENAVRYTATAKTEAINATMFQEMCVALKNGAYIAVTTGISAAKPSDGHIVVLYGINEHGEVLYLDSDNGNHRVGVYDDFFTGAIPFQNFTGPNSDIIIVEKV